MDTAPGLIPNYTRDPKDDYLIDAALRGQADYLVTGDFDLLALADDPAISVQIVSPSTFLAMLAGA